MKISSGLATVFVSLLIAGCAERGSEDARTDEAAKGADFVLTNARVYTVDDDQPWAEAIAITGNQIVYVGDNAGAKALAGDNSELIDLQGRLILPGLVESHIHIGTGGATTSGIILSAADSLDDVLNKVREYAAANPDKATIMGASYFAGLFVKKDTPAIIDERDLAIKALAKSNGSLASYVSFILLAMGIWIYHGPDALISVNILPMCVCLIGVVFWMVESLTYIIEYGKDNKQSEGGAV